MSSLNPPEVNVKDTPSSITPAALAYSVAMDQRGPILPPGSTSAAQAIDTSKDVLMADATPERAAVSV